MTTIPVITLARTAFALALLAPAAACAKPVDEASSSRHAAAATAPGVSLATFVSRHEKKLLAGDTDGNGKVSRAEFLAAGRVTNGDPGKRFAKLDTNGDGLLDKTEIEAVLSRRFKRLDTNGDGMLSADERAAAHAHRSKGAGDGSKP